MEISAKHDIFGNAVLFTTEFSPQLERSERSNSRV